MIKKFAALFSVLLLSLTLSACGESYDFEAFDKLEDELIEAVNNWDNVSLINEIKLEMQGVVSQHMILEVHVDEENDRSYVHIRDLMAEDEPILNYIYVEGNTAYTYENRTMTEDEDAEEKYDMEELDNTENRIPAPLDLLLNALTSYPGEELLDEEDIEYEVYSVQRDGDEFSVRTKAIFTTDQGEQELEWTIKGNFDEFHVDTPDPQAGIFTFTNKDFFADFDGIDYARHEAGAQERIEQEEQEENDETEDDTEDETEE